VKGIGPIEVVAFSFPGNQFKGEIIPALQELVQSGTIRIVDLAVIVKNEAGEALAFEIADLEPTASQALMDLVDEDEGIFSDEDFAAFGESMEPNSTEALMIFEHVWATKFAEAVAGANGKLVLAERIPRVVVEALFADAE